MPEKENFDEDDSFWNIDTLMPVSRLPKSARRFGEPQKRAVSGNEDRAGGDQERRNPTGKDLARKDFHAPADPPVKTPPTSAAHAPEKEVSGSSTKGNALPKFSAHPEKSYECRGAAISRVDIYPWPNSYAFFENFRKNGLALREMHGQEVPSVPYFSFMPQYHQLTAAQLHYYLYFRECFLKNEFLRADFSYLLLYIYEIINLPDVIPPEKGVNLLAKLWIAYRKTYPKLDKYLSEWLVDYCLVHCVRPEKKLFERIAAAGRQAGSFGEFYMSSEEYNEPSLLLSSYSYKESKYFTEERVALFEEHIPAAMALFSSYLEKSDPSYLKKEGVPVKISRTSYDGAVCVYNQKKRLDIFYRPVRMTASTLVITDAVKLCENHLRARCGVRARLSTPSLTAPMRKVIDDYFASHLPFSSASGKEKRRQDYESKYDAENKGFSFAEAAEIERSSLSVVKRLGSVFEEELLPEDSAMPGEKEKNGGAGKEEAAKYAVKEADIRPLKESSKVLSDETRRSEENRSALAALLSGGNILYLKKAAEYRLLPHTLAERINEEALLRYGDIALEERDGVFSYISDYKEELMQWINN